MKRRDFLKATGVAAAAATIVGAPHISKGWGKTYWRMQTYAGSELSRHVVKPGVDLFNYLANGEWKIELFYSDDIVPQNKLWEAVGSGEIDIGQSDEESAGCPLDVAVFSGYFPFAVRNPLDVPALWSQDGLKEIWEEAYKETPEITWLGAGAWDPCNIITKTPILTVDDIKGKKLYTFPTGGKFLSKFGVVPVMMQYQDVYAELQTDKLDGVAWCGVTEAYAVGWAHNLSYCLGNNISGAWVGSYFVNTKKWNEMPTNLQRLLLATIDHCHYLRSHWYWWGEAYYRANGGKLELTTIPIDEWHTKVVNEAIRFWDTIARKSPRCAKIIKIFNRYNDTMEKAGPPYRCYSSNRPMER